MNKQERFEKIFYFSHFLRLQCDAVDNYAYANAKSHLFKNGRIEKKNGLETVFVCCK